MRIEDIRLLKTNLELLIEGRDPKTGYKVDDTILNSSTNKQILKDTVSILNSFLRLDFNPTKIDKRKKYAFYLSEEERNSIVISDTPVTISAFVHRLNAPIKPTMKKITIGQITKWLVDKGYLSEVIDEYGKKVKIATKQSSSIGINTEERISDAGRLYHVVVYDKFAQQFIIENLDDIVDQEIHYPVKP